MIDPSLKVVKCRSCGAAIVWAVTERGKRIPLDAEPNQVKGNMVLVYTEPGQEGGAGGLRARSVSPLLDTKVNRYMPHHATCPDGKKWRR